MSDDPGREAVEHLQQAAVEMIRATRAFLELLETLVQDAGPLVGAVSDLAARGRAAARPPGPPRGGDGGDGGDGGVEHIRVS